MNEITSISAIENTTASHALKNASQMQASDEMRMGGSAVSDQLKTSSFTAILEKGLAQMDAKLAHADQMVTQFAVDDNTPIHQVTIALEEARLAVELAMQVRQRFVEGYRELMNMQL